MRLHHITIENITSFKGKHEIDFDTLTEMGDLFAITGPTGSGKSSILTALSLSLYGKNYKAGLTQGDYVSLGEHKAKIELDFSVSGERYKAIWACTISKKSGKSTPKRLLYKGTEVLEDSAEEIIGLSFNQFCKTVILNQGQFADFLTSTFTKRKAILEKLYDNDVLSFLSMELKEQLKALKQEKEVLTGKIDHSELFSKDEYEKKKEASERMKSELDSITPLLNHLKETEEIIKNLLKLEEQKNTSLERQKKYEQKITTLVEEFNNAKSIRQKREEDLQKAEQTQKKEAPDLQKAIELRSLLSSAKNQHQAIVRELEKINQSINSEETKSKKLEQECLERKASIKETEKTLSHGNVEGLIPVIDEFKQVISKTSSTEANFQTLQDHKDETLKSLSDIEKDLKELEESQKKIYPEESTDLSPRDYFLAKKEQLVLSIEKLSKAEVKEETLDKTIQSTHKTLKRIREDFTQKEAILKQKEMELDLTIQEKDLLQKEKKLQELKEAIVICQEEANNKGICPVCSNKVTRDLKSNQDELPDETIQKKIEERSQNITELKTQIGVLKHDLSTLTRQSKESESELNRTEKEIIELRNEFSKEPLAETKKKRENEQRSLDQIIDQYKSIHENIKLNTKQKQILEEKLTQATPKLQEAKEMVFELSKKQAALLKVIAKEAPSYPTLPSLIIELFEKDQKNWEALKKERQELELKLKDLSHGQTTITSLKESLKDKTEKKNKEEQSIKKIEEDLKTLPYSDDPKKRLSELQGHLDQTRRLFEDSRKKCQNMEVEKNSLETSINHLTEQRDSITQTTLIEHGRLKKTTIPDYQGSLKDHENTKRYLQTMSELDWSTLSKEEYGEAQTHFYNDVLTPLLDLLKHEKEEVTKIHIAGLEELRIYEEQQNKVHKLEKELKELQEKLYTKEELFEILGHDDFRSFVLGLIEETLVAFTNKELEQLCDGRYELTSTIDNDFYVIDHYKGSLRRKVNSLSGGESFLVSLALALSLAELSRGKTEIDSFFIDEGFGTLDEDHIDDVMDVLLSLNNRGKQLGVISHIKSLTNRIPVNIELEKDNQGIATLSTIFN